MTHGQKCGNSLDLIGQVLNHRNSSTTEIGARFAQDPVPVATVAHAERLMGEANKKAPAEMGAPREARR